MLQIAFGWWFDFKQTNNDMISLQRPRGTVWSQQLQQ